MSTAHLMTTLSKTWFYATEHEKLGTIRQILEGDCVSFSEVVKALIRQSSLSLCQKVGLLENYICEHQQVKNICF